MGADFEEMPEGDLESDDDSHERGAETQVPEEIADAMPTSETSS